MRDFLKGIGRHWVRFVMGSAPFAILTVGAALVAPVPRWLYGVAVLFGLLNAAFGVWKDERDRADRAEAEVARIQAEDVSPRKMTDDLYWLLSLIERHGARRHFVYEAVSGATVNALHIGDSAISHMKTSWLYDLVEDACTKDLLVLDKVRQTYSIPEAIATSLAFYRRKGRPLITPNGVLNDLQGQRLNLDL